MRLASNAPMGPAAAFDRQKFRISFHPEAPPCYAGRVSQRMIRNQSVMWPVAGAEHCEQAQGVAHRANASRSRQRCDDLIISHRAGIMATPLQVG